MLFSLPDILLSVTAIANVGLTWFVYQRDKDRPVNKLFSLFVAFIAFWAIVILLYRLVDTPGPALYLMKLSYLSALLLAFFFYQFSRLFPDDAPSHGARERAVLWLVTLISAYIVLPGTLAIRILPHEWGKETVLEPVGWAVFAAAFLFFFISGQLRLLFKAFTVTGVPRIQLWIISVSVIVAGAFGMYYNLVLPSPFFQDFRYIWSGPIFTFAFAVVMMYAVFRLRLFNPRAILAEFLVYTLLLVLFVRLLLTDTLSDLLINGGVLVAASIVGTLLIRSVTKEVEQREEIEHLSEEKSEFMTFASHEIRNPITAMRGFASLIVDGTTGQIAPATKDAAEKILVTGNEVLALIGQFLSKSKMELGQIAYSISPFDIAAAVRTVAEGYKPHAEQKGLALTIDIRGPATVRADEGKVKEVVGNIIDNSLKYTKSGSITVSVSTEKGRVRTTIADTGVGIPAETLPKLFKKFSRADAQRANLLGTGVGLYLAKTFIEAMGGKIWAESDGKDKGSRFIIEFPAA